MGHCEFPILKDFDRNFSKKRNYLRDKYPDVPFKDEDISRYDYESDEPEALIMQQFLDQYNVKDLLITVTFDNNTINKYYLYDVKVKQSKHDKPFALLCKTYEHKKNEFTFHDSSDNEFNLLKPRLKFSTDFRLYMHYCVNAKCEIEINPDRKVLDDYISVFVDELLSEYNNESIIYKHPNGIGYFTDKYYLTKNIDVYIRKNDTNLPKFKIETEDVVEPFKKYHIDGAVKNMPKESKQITFEQMKTEIKSLCYYYENNVTFPECRTYYETELKEKFKGQNLIFEHNVEGDYGRTRTYEITDYVPKAKKEVTFKEVSINKKDKHIGNFESFDDIDQTIKDHFLSILVEKLGDDLDYNILTDLRYFASELDLDLYENEEYDGDYFYYTNTYLIGEYKIMFNSSKYIKDQCICDLQLDSINIYKI